MGAPQNIIALIFDFDDTLTDDSTTKLLECNGIDSHKFWKELVKERVDSGWDPTLAYLDLLLDSIGENRPLGIISNNDLREFGNSLDFYSGIPELFNILEEHVKKYKITRPSIEFYIISGGIEEIIRGSSIAKYCKEIWGCTFEEENGVISKIKNVISFTDKTRYLFCINKGLNGKARSDQYLVNEYVAKCDRRIPFENMIYIGDGLTDVPCFSLIQLFNGQGYGVFNPSQVDSPKKALEKLVIPKRVMTMNSPRYGDKDDLGAIIISAVNGLCLRMEAASRSAGHYS